MLIDKLISVCTVAYERAWMSVKSIEASLSDSQPAVVFFYLRTGLPRLVPFPILVYPNTTLTILLAYILISFRRFLTRKAVEKLPCLH